MEVLVAQELRLLHPFARAESISASKNVWELGHAQFANARMCWERLYVLHNFQNPCNFDAFSPLAGGLAVVRDDCSFTIVIRTRQWYQCRSQSLLIANALDLGSDSLLLDTCSHLPAVSNRVPSVSFATLDFHHAVHGYTEPAVLVGKVLHFLMVWHGWWMCCFWFVVGWGDRNMGTILLNWLGG